MGKGRAIYLDIFRGVGSIFIILYHLTTRYDQMIGHAVQYPFSLPWGWMAWSIFFILTGFLVRPKHERVMDFIWGKVVRLFPGFWAAMILCFFVTHFFLPEFAVSIVDFLIDLTMLGNYLGRASVVGVDWTLSVNLVYYAFIVSIMLLEKRTKKLLFIKFAIVWSRVMVFRIQYLNLQEFYLQRSMHIFL